MCGNIFGGYSAARLFHEAVGTAHDQHTKALGLTGRRAAHSMAKDVAAQRGSPSRARATPRHVRQGRPALPCNRDPVIDHSTVPAL
ncbi:DUF2563 family protein [Mycobacterium riyadhense]|uniref:DUF2563 family protein n=1 Tax=Mycobacterium riyadhense TaxID=486698 RepID=UPI00111BDE74|nr:DUF2563 family protein [Mycobacterium riyadhense]